jgi:hypothetical protein
MPHEAQHRSSSAVSSVGDHCIPLLLLSKRKRNSQLRRTAVGYAVMAAQRNYNSVEVVATSLIIILWLADGSDEARKKDADVTSSERAKNPGPERDPGHQVISDLQHDWPSSYL